MPAAQMTKDQLQGLIKEIVETAIKTRIEEHSAHVRNEHQAHLASLVAAARGAGGERKPEKGILAAQMILALAASVRSLKQGQPVSAVDFARKQWGAESPVAKALSASDFAAGGALIPPEMAAEVIELLRPQSVVRRLNPVIYPMDSGTADIPKLTGGASASYVGENQNLPKTEPTTGTIKATARKLGAIIPISNDWIRRPKVGGESIVRDDLIAALSQRGDLAFIRGVGSQYSPRGLRYWAKAANVINANATVNLANVTTDLGKLWLQLANADVRFLRPGWLFSPRTFNYLMNVRDGNGNFAFREEMMQGRLWGYPFAYTTQIPSNLGGGSDESEVYLADFADVVLAEQEGLIIDVFDGAAYHDGSNVISAVSQDQTVLRAIQEHDLVMRHDESVAVLAQVKWI